MVVDKVTQSLNVKGIYPRGLIEPPEHPLDPLERLQRDIVAASKMLTLQEVGYLVTHYYTIQEYRKAAMSQERTLRGEMVYGSKLSADQVKQIRIRHENGAKPSVLAG